MSPQPNELLRPFLKWAGGKRWLASAYPYLFPKDYDRYFEPFLGGAAVFFSLRPKKSILSDANERLIECYRALRDEPAAFARQMSKHQRLHSDRYYYSVRDRAFRNAVSRATQFLYLNRTCWNGLYRVNLRGEFNVPRGTKSSVVFEGERFRDYAAALATADLRCCDFEKTIRLARSGDFVFVDPPYTTKHKFNGFIKYNEKIFSWADQVRLRAALEAAAKSGRENSCVQRRSQEHSGFVWRSGNGRNALQKQRLGR